MMVDITNCFAGLNPGSIAEYEVPPAFNMDFEGSPQFASIPSGAPFIWSHSGYFQESDALIVSRGHIEDVSAFVGEVDLFRIYIQIAFRPEFYAVARPIFYCQHATFGTGMFGPLPKGFADDEVAPEYIEYSHSDFAFMAGAGWTPLPNHPFFVSLSINYGGSSQQPGDAFTVTAIECDVGLPSEINCAGGPSLIWTSYVGTREVMR